MIVTDMHPLSMAEDEGFQRIISTFNPRYTPPSRKLWKKKYEEIKGRPETTLKGTDSIEPTTDIWRDTQLQILQRCLKVIVKFDISIEKVKAVVHDIGANVKLQ